MAANQDVAEAALSEAAAGPDDLLRLEDFDDSALLGCLKSRYERQDIYTWVGSVLVSVNPYRDIGAFSDAMVARYTDPARTSQAPHLFGALVAALAAKGDQHALLITGESGAGKTEATRAALAFLARSCGSTDHIRDRLLDSNPVLEAFGNAMTRQNGNSSRFGKFIEVQISPDGVLAGATLRPYMLEASRVTGLLPPKERTYHIFYQLRAALGALASGETPTGGLWETLQRAPEWGSLAKSAGACLTRSSRLASGPPAERCLEDFEALCERLLHMGMSHGHLLEVARVVTAVAVLADEDIAGDELLAAMEELLGVAPERLQYFFARVETAVGAGGREKLVRCRGEHESRTLRASLAQELYSSLFGWVTRIVASGVAPPAWAPCGRRLGLLDLYGFEVFGSNGFEQLLINYCNERIQQLFNRQVFLAEAEEYMAEGLDCQGQWQGLVVASCRLPALALLEGEPGGAPGIFGVISDRSRCGFDASAASGTGVEVVEAIAAACGQHPALRLRAGSSTGRAFGVAHFAGEVFYEAKHFVDKNAGAHKPDIVAFFRAEGRGLAREIFEAQAEAPAVEAAGAPGRRRLLGSTLISAFRQQLNELCANLEASECRHIRCLRPNDSQAPSQFDGASMLRQCRYSGLLEASRIRSYGFAHRRSLANFAERYAPILRAERRASGSAPPASASEACARICGWMKAAGVDPADFSVGRTKVFLRKASLAWLEEARIQLCATSVAANLRAWHARTGFLRLRAAAVRLQASYRGHATRAVIRRWLAQRSAKRAADAERRQALALAVAAARCLQRWWRRRRAAKENQLAASARLAAARAELAVRAEEEQYKAKRRAGWGLASSAKEAASPREEPASLAARSPRGGPSLASQRVGGLSPWPQTRSIPTPGGRVMWSPPSAEGLGGKAEKEAAAHARPPRKTQVPGTTVAPPADRRGAGAPTKTQLKRMLGATGVGTPAGGDRLLHRLLQVGRALKERQIPPERAEMLEGLLDSLQTSPGEAASAAMQALAQSPSFQPRPPSSGQSTPSRASFQAPPNYGSPRLTPHGSPKCEPRQVRGAPPLPPGARVSGRTPTSVVVTQPAWNASPRPVPVSPVVRCYSRELELSPGRAPSPRGGRAASPRTRPPPLQRMASLGSQAGSVAGGLWESSVGTPSGSSPRRQHGGETPRKATPFRTGVPSGRHLPSGYRSANSVH